MRRFGGDRTILGKKLLASDQQRHGYTLRYFPSRK
jgi:hypothetical protein